jgi:hypothetical protein
MLIATPNRPTNGAGSPEAFAGLPRVLRERRPLEEVNEAFDDVLHARNTAPRVVLTV